MISFKQDMDPHSLHIMRKMPNGDDKHIGYIQWHTGKDPRIELFDTFKYLTLSEAQAAINELEWQLMRKSKKAPEER